MNGSVFSKAGCMNGVGFKIPARTPVPKLPISSPPPPHTHTPPPPPPPPHPTRASGLLALIMFIFFLVIDMFLCTCSYLGRKFEIEFLYLVSCVFSCSFALSFGIRSRLRSMVVARPQRRILAHLSTTC